MSDEFKKGLGTILIIMFLITFAEKLIPGTAVYNWSWIWVVGPLWIPIALCIVLPIAVILIYTIIGTLWICLKFFWDWTKEARRIKRGARKNYLKIIKKNS